MKLFVLPRKKSCLIVLVVDIIGIVIEQNLGLVVTYERVDDPLFGGGQGVETGEDDALLADSFNQFCFRQLRQMPGNHAVIAFSLHG